MYSIHDFVYTSLYLLAFKKRYDRLNEETKGMQRSGDSITSSLKDKEYRTIRGVLGLRCPGNLWLELSSTELGIRTQV